MAGSSLLYWVGWSLSYFSFSGGELVEGKERRWIWIFTLTVLAVSTIPYLLGYWVQGDQWRFLGFIFGISDGNSYIAKMLGGAAGDWLFRTPYTAYPQNGAFAFFPYILLGKLSAPPAQHEQLVFLFQLFRWVGGFILAFATYDFVALFVKKIQNRRLALAVILLGGGLGWLSAIGISALWQSRIPLEFYSPETFGYLSLLGLPHLEVARAFLLWGLRDYLANGKDYSNKRAIKAGLMWLGMGLFQPLTVVVGWIVIGLHTFTINLWKGIEAYREKNKFRLNAPEYLRTTILMAVCSAPIVFYSFVSFTFDPFLRSWTAQNLILSPPPGDYLLAFGAMLPLAIIGIYSVFKRKDWDGILLGLWVCIIPILAYAPYNLQRRLPDGVWVAILTLVFIVVERYLAKYQKWVNVLCVFAFLPSFFFLMGAFLAVSQPAEPLFAPKSQIDAFAELNKIASKNDVVLASFETANNLPAWAPLRTVLGHGPESINAAELSPEIALFFNEKGSDQARLDLIAEFNIKYVILGPDEQKPGSWNPDQSRFVELDYQESPYKVYRIIK
jgi:hypothetical protein